MTSRSAHVLGWICLAASLVWFCAAFDPGDASVKQHLIDSLWLVAVLLWSVQILALTPQRKSGVDRRWDDRRPILALLVVFSLVWLPFYDNWRWAYTGDSIAWFGPAYDAATHGLHQNLLSLKGPDNNFTYLHSLAFNLPMFVFAPTFFWHRVGKLILSCGSLAAIYVFFAHHLRRWWALAIVACVATNYVWLWFSYVSYPHIDSLVFAYAALTAATLLWRDPDALGAWLALGLTAGFSLFFTQTAWATISATGAVVGLRSLQKKRYKNVAICCGTFLLAGAPVFLQWPTLKDMTMRQAGSLCEFAYLRRIFTAILMQPYDSAIFGLGVRGAFLRRPLGHMYLFGGAIAILALIAPVRRFFRIPDIAPGLLLLLLWESGLMALTNNAYGDPSTKRTYHLIPLQVFLALLPGYTCMCWARQKRFLRKLVAGGLGALITIYGVENLRLIVYPAPAMYGSNEFDGLIELRQRYADRKVVFFTSRPQMSEWLLSPQGFYATVYHLPDTLTVERDFTLERLRTACAADAIICHAPYPDAERFERMSKEVVHLRPLPILNSRQLLCAQCLPSRSPPPRSESHTTVPNPGARFIHCRPRWRVALPPRSRTYDTCL